jgi:predicted nucleic acid-binding protein
MIVLDTNVLSEAIKPVPASDVLHWIASQPASSLFTTTITQAELLLGIELMPAGKRRNALNAVVEGILNEDFRGRVLPFDTDAARLYARIVSGRRAAGRPMQEMDAQIAAIARSRGAALATRNTTDFERCSVALVDPWNAAKLKKSY